MTDEPKTPVSGAESDEGKLPQPTFTSPSPASPTSGLTPEAISALSEALKPVIKDTVARELQSTKDKRFSNLEKGESVLREVLTAIKEGGGTIPAALEQRLQIEDTVTQVLAKLGVDPNASKSIPAPQADDKSAQFDVVKGFEKYGLSTNDPEALALLRGTYASPANLELAMANLAIKKAKPSTPSSTVSPAPTGGTSVDTGTLTDEKKEELAGEYQKLSYTPSQNGARMKEIEKLLGWA